LVYSARITLTTLKIKFLFLFLIIFTLITAVEIWGEELYRLNGESTLLFIAKPMLMPVLMIFLFINTRLHSGFDKLVFTGFILAWIGDILLMFRNDDLFVFGLASFLVCHIMYIIAFVKNIRTSGHKASGMNRFILALLPLFYLIVLYSYLYPHIANNEKNQPFLIPVTVYAVTIVTMSLFALWRIGSSNRNSVVFIIIGAFVFMISDSLIALNKFVSPFQGADIFIMFTYCLAQLCITIGCIHHSKRSLSALKTT
jgi:uncharacterized membrane protein YhhN